MANRAGATEDGEVDRGARAGAEQPPAGDSAEVLHWCSGVPPGPLDRRSMLELPVVDMARALLGCRLVSTVGGERSVGVIVETEAYGGPEDPASHAATVSGVTFRNRAMFGPAGYAYIYRSYGVHWCMNVVAGPEGEASAVLIRGIEALEGVEVMTRRRRGRRPVGAGPGRLCQALGITDRLYGHDLELPPLVLEGGWPLPHHRVRVSRRVGVTAGVERAHRFYVEGSTGVSRFR